MYDSLIAASRQSEKKGNIEHVHEIEKPLFFADFSKMGTQPLCAQTV